MEEWKQLSKERKQKLNYALMMEAAKEANRRGLLNFEPNQPFFEGSSFFIMDLGNHNFGTVKVTQSDYGKKIVKFDINFVGCRLKSHIARVGPTFSTDINWLPPKFELRFGPVIDVLLDLANNPTEMDEVFA